MLVFAVSPRKFIAMFGDFGLQSLKCMYILNYDIRYLKWSVYSINCQLKFLHYLFMPLTSRSVENQKC